MGSCMLFMLRRSQSARAARAMSPHGQGHAVTEWAAAPGSPGVLRRMCHEIEGMQGVTSHMENRLRAAESEVTRAVSHGH